MRLSDRILIYDSVCKEAYCQSIVVMCGIGYAEFKIYPQVFFLKKIGYISKLYKTQILHISKKKNSSSCTERREERGENVMMFKELSQRLITDKTAPP